MEEPKVEPEISGDGDINEGLKRKIDVNDDDEDSTKKVLRLEDGQEEPTSEGDLESDDGGSTSPVPSMTEGDMNDDEYDAETKIDQLLEAVTSNMPSEKDDSDEEENDEQSKDQESETDETKMPDLKTRKATNLRKNIKDVLDDTQLDASTLAAQREESERLARVQEQQRMLREMQRQIAMEKFSRDEEKVLQFLQGQATSGKSQGEITLSKVEKKISLSEEIPSVSITSVTRKPEPQQAETIKKDVVTIVDRYLLHFCIKNFIQLHYIPVPQTTIALYYLTTMKLNKKMTMTLTTVAYTQTTPTIYLITKAEFLLMLDMHLMNLISF